MDQEATTEWPTCDPDLVLAVLHKLSTEHCPNGREFYKTFTSWGELNEVQRNKVKFVWNQLTEPVKFQVNLKANEAAASAYEDARVRAENTNKHDRCKLFHVMALGSAQAKWTAAFSPLSREELDNPTVRNSAYKELAEIFNDYDEYSFRNVCITYDDEGIAINPCVPLAGLEAVADLCWDLNPNNRDRPVRNGAWVEKFSKEIRSTMTKAYEA
jgi:hypothetical protein